MNSPMPLGEQISNAAHTALDPMVEGVDQARAQAGQVLNRLVSDADKLTRRGVAAVREGSQQLRETTARATDSTLGYIRDEPVKSVLIAAAVGATLMALVTLVSRSRD